MAKFETNSDFNIGETVTLDLFKSGRINDCIIKSVTFLGDGLITYSVSIPTGDDNFVTVSNIGFIYLIKQD